MRMWTVYDHPADYPDSYVAREFIVFTGGPMPTTNFMACPDLELLRDELYGMGLVSLARSPEDEPKIVEVWL